MLVVMVTMLMVMFLIMTMPMTTAIAFCLLSFALFYIFHDFNVLSIPGHRFFYAVKFGGKSIE